MDLSSDLRLSRAQGPYANLTIDTAGNLYGTSLTGGVYGYGSVFKLTHAAGGWTYAVLHDFRAEQMAHSPSAM